MLPERILSVSECIVDIIPEPGERFAEPYNAFDIEEIGWPNVFYSTPDAWEFIRRSLPEADDLVILGIGLHLTLVDAYLTEEQPPAGAKGASGVYEAISRGKGLDPGGENLGFEVLGLECGGSPHSWLCNGLEMDAWRELGIRPNERGFLGTLDEAQRCAQYANRPESGAEPVFWLPWLIVRYPATGTKLAVGRARVVRDRRQGDGRAFVRSAGAGP